MMLNAFNSDLNPLLSGEFRVGDTRHTVSDISKLQRLGWTPTAPVEQNVRCSGAEDAGFLAEQFLLRQCRLSLQRALHDLIKLLYERGVLGSSERVVLFNTGTGLKYPKIPGLRVW
jgi:hypothetical protein